MTSQTFPSALSLGLPEQLKPSHVANVLEACFNEPLRLFSRWAVAE